MGRRGLISKTVLPRWCADPSRARKAALSLPQGEGKIQRPSSRTSAVVLSLVSLLVSACASAAQSRYTRAELEARLEAKRAGLPDPGDSQHAASDTPASLLIGEFPLDTKHPILDGDTIRVIGLNSSLRLLGVDTEETFKKEHERRAYAAGWEEYMKAVRGSSSRPVKFATPMGEEAKHFAEEFFSESSKVRLERDHPGEVRDFYGRFLAYVFGKRNGKWMNYNVEAVRAGMSPYFEKYGRSRRFHAEFVQAQKEAKAARRGIWDSTKQHYPDYAERFAWWNARGQAVAEFEAANDGRKDVVILTRFDAIRRLRKLVNQQVTIFGSVGDIRIPKAEKAPTIVELQRNRRMGVPLVFFKPELFQESKLGKHRGEFVAVSGKVVLYDDKPQVIINSTKQIRLFEVPKTVTASDRAEAPEVDDEAPDESEVISDSATEEDDSKQDLADPNEVREDAVSPDLRHSDDADPWQDSQ